jgi:PqqD family protein of HPr-rel-A system
MKWHIDSIGRFYDCGESTVVYFDPSSGDTHLISDFAAHLMRHIGEAEGSLDIGEIIQLVTDDIEPDDLRDLSNAIPRILNELTDLDIIAPG